MSIFCYLILALAIRSTLHAFVLMARSPRA